MKRRYIDWSKTAKNLKLLRNDNLDLRKYVCKTLDVGDRGCVGNCDKCKFEMDHSISQSELARAFKVTESMVVNWENGKSRPSLEHLLFYSDVCKLDLFEVVIMANNDRNL